MRESLFLTVIDSLSFIQVVPILAGPKVGRGRGIIIIVPGIEGERICRLIFVIWACVFYDFLGIGQ